MTKANPKKFMVTTSQPIVKISDFNVTVAKPSSNNTDPLIFNVILSLFLNRYTSEPFDKWEDDNLPKVKMTGALNTIYYVEKIVIDYKAVDFNKIINTKDKVGDVLPATIFLTEEETNIKEFEIINKDT